MDYETRVFESAEQFLNSHSLCDSPACLLLDMKMPGLDGFDLQEKLIKMNSILPIVFITGHGDIQMGVKAIKKGALDFLTHSDKID